MHQPKKSMKWKQSYTEFGFRVLLLISVISVTGIHAQEKQSEHEKDRAVQVAVGGDLSCALLESGAVYCWGLAEALGSQGSSASGNDHTELTGAPVKVENLPRIRSIASGRLNYCAIDFENQAWCWGVDWTASQKAGRQVVSGPAKVDGLPPVLQISIGFVHACAVAASDGAVWCWGDNPGGELGDGSTEMHLEPAKVPKLTNVVSVSTGVNNTCAITETGDTYCWGTDDQRAPGKGFIIKSPKPQLVLGHKGTARGLAIANGRNFACLARYDGSVVCFGSNIFKQLGSPSPDYFGFSTVDVSGQARIVSSGYFSSCAITSQGKLVCWGIPIGVEQDKPSGVLPGPIAGINGATGVSVYGEVASACVVDGLGGVKCFGHNRSGVLGPDIPLNALTSTPTAVRGLP